MGQPLPELVTQRRELLGFRSQLIGIVARREHPAVPDVAQHVIRKRGWQRQQERAAKGRDREDRHGVNPRQPLEVAGRPGEGGDPQHDQADATDRSRAEIPGDQKGQMGEQNGKRIPRQPAAG
jgi:hypothetical protein